MRAVLVPPGSTFVTDVLIVEDGTHVDPRGAIYLSDTAGIGWSYDGTTFHSPVEAAPTPTDLNAYAMQQFNNRVIAGIQVNVAPAGSAQSLVLADTNTDGRINIMGLYTKAKEDSTFTTLWRQSTGSLTINATQTILIGDSVFSYYSELQAVLATIEMDINSGKTKTTAQIDSAGWPSTAYGAPVNGPTGATGSTGASGSTGSTTATGSTGATS